MNAKFNLCRWTLLVISVFCLLKESSGSFCSMEKMKTVAMEACEHLFQQDEAARRDKRSIEYSHHHLNRLGYGKLHDKHHYITRSNYPMGGYLKVNRDHYRRLSELDVVPRYKPKKIHHEKKERFKRDHASSSYNNISYCCLNSCNEEFFC
ncbi:GL16065 [Drosophila persimilis]|uniref:Uncharacterized protein Ilp8 n=2 Tax=pseudoobscura subgroup TaxID=32358 RepID=Q29EX8_DROPS|nr:uncharacterized protein LOC4812108 [Drosophila pseudoobscura]XP_002026167.1 uncharacterized protein LOC6601012 [Drosophila persimilis]XP_017138842.1 uncharacterized protein LOC108153380 [Drosophila miranda]EDW33090.1 GL16065 [Drosophila persimilis]